jgi:transcriptional regulator with XRE-family HTH domain
MELNAAVRELREKTGDSQQSFATRLKLSIRAVVNYEKDRTPSPKALAAMAHLARRHGEYDLANQFWSALPEELQFVPLLKLPADASVGADDAKIMFEMLPEFHFCGPDGSTEVVLSDPRKAIARCVRDLQSLLLSSPASSDSHTDTIRKVVERLQKINQHCLRICPSASRHRRLRNRSTHRIAPSGMVTATNEPMDIGQVILIAGFRFAVAEELNRAEFERRCAENQVRRTQQETQRGFQSAGTFIAGIDGSKAVDAELAIAPDADMTYFYALRLIR